MLFASSLSRVLLAGIFLASVWQSLVEATDACTRLPRIEVQFLCDRPLIEEGFNATEIFEDYYDSKIFPNRLNHTQNDDKPYDLQLYVSVGINTAQDASPREWYSQRCNMYSNETLVTIDVRGYQHWDEPKDFHDSNNNSNSSDSESTDSSSSSNGQTNEAHWWKDYPSFGNIEAYLSSKVCGGNEFDFFRAAVYPWDETSYPIPSLGQAEECGTRKEEPLPTPDIAQVRGGGQVVYPSSSILRYDGLKSNSSLPKDAYTKRYELKVFQGGYNYDHDLYYVCEGAHLVGADDEMPSPIFWLFGVLVGYYMVFMIKAEFARPLRYQQLPRNASNNNNNNNGSDNDSSRNTSHESSNSSSSNSNSDNDNIEDDGTDSPQRHQQEIELMTLNPVMV